MTARQRSGHVYRRRTTDGGWSSWYAVVDTDPHDDGRRRQVTRSFTTRAEAYAWLASQPIGGKAGVTLGGWLQQWLDGQEHLRPSTRASYRGHIDKHLTPLLGGMPVAMLTAENVRGLHAALRQQGVSAATTRRIHATLSSALSAAVREGVIPGNPAALVTLPRGNAYRADVWDAGEAARFLHTVRGDALYPLWRLALLTGMRRGELLGLTWDDVDLTTGTLTVRQTRVAVAGQVVTGPPKSRRGVRAIAVDPATVAVLNAYRVRGPRTGVVFHDGNGRPLRPGDVSRRFADLVERAGLPRIRLHDLRHTSASLGLAAGEPLKALSARLGHSSITVTADTYLAVPDALARASASALARTLDDPGAKGAA